MTYNHLNLVKLMSLPDNQSISYQYLADGTKVSKSLYTNEGNGTTSSVFTDYIDGFVYRSQSSITVTPGIEFKTAVAFQKTIFTPLEELIAFPSLGLGSSSAELQFFPTAEGFYDYKNSKYIYQYKDHLGNVRVNYAKNLNGSAEALDTNDYYPFGLNHGKDDFGGTVFGAGGSYVNYKYNGKELTSAKLEEVDKLGDLQKVDIGYGT